jgi:hypothetical protein
MGLVTVFITRRRKFERELVPGVSNEMISVARIVSVVVLAAIFSAWTERQQYRDCSW